MSKTLGQILKNYKRLLKPEFRTPLVEKHLEYMKMLCNHLDEIEKSFKAGKTKADALAAFQQSHSI
jgi:hypothetical protein